MHVFTGNLKGLAINEKFHKESHFIALTDRQLITLWNTTYIHVY